MIFYQYISCNFYLGYEGGEKFGTIFGIPDAIDNLLYLSNHTVMVLHESCVSSVIY